MSELSPLSGLLDGPELPTFMPGETVPSESTPLAYYDMDGQFVTDDPVEGHKRWMAIRSDGGGHFVSALSYKDFSVDISTAFLPTNHNWWHGPPLVWETMMTGNGEWSDWQYRYCTRAAALNGHKLITMKFLEAGFRLTEHSGFELTAEEN